MVFEYARVEVFLHRLSTSNRCQSNEKNDVRENKIAEVKIHVPGADFFAKRRSSSFEASVDDALDAIRRQILKQKKVRTAVA